MAENKEPERPMRLLASDCNDLFEQVINTSAMNQQGIVSQTIEYRDAFSALTSFLCIYDEPDSCLDYRLRKHESIQDIMIRLLELPRQNLFMFFSLSKTISDPLLDVRSEVAAALDGVKDSLKSLNNFAITIRQSSRSSALTLARNFATSKRRLEDLEELILISLESLYPNAPESLRMHICNTLTDRYARLQYDAELYGASRSKSSKQNEGVQTTEEPSDHEPIQESSIISRSKTLEFDHIQKKAQEENPNVPQRPISSLDTGILRQSFNDKDVKTSQSKRTLSVYESDGHIHEPVPPQFKDARLHYKRDLKPFPCLSESCGESRPSFPSRKQWLEHMRLKHSTTCPQNLYGEMIWVCNDHGEDGETTSYAFSSQDELEQHILLIHQSGKRLSSNDLTMYVKYQPLLNGTICPAACPLCFFAIENTLGENEASRLKSRGTMLGDPTRVQSGKKDQERVSVDVRFAPEVKETPDLDPGDDTVYDSSTLFALELHIAAHLQYLLVMSLRLMEILDHDTDEERLTGLYGSNNPATESISSRNDATGLNAWSDEDIALVHISDSDRLQLEEMRTNGEAAEYVLPSYIQNQWDDFDLLVQGPTEQDSIIQDLNRKQTSRSRIAVLRESIERLRHQSHDALAEGDRWRLIAVLEAEIFNESHDLNDLEQAIETGQKAVKASLSGQSVDLKSLVDLSCYLFEKYRIAPLRSDLDTAINITQKAIEITDHSNSHQLLDLSIRLCSLHRWLYSESGEYDDLRKALVIAQQAMDLVPERSGRREECHYNLGLLLTLVYWRTGIETTVDETIHELRLGSNSTVEGGDEDSEYLATLSAGLYMKFAISGSRVELDEAIDLIRASIRLTSEGDSAFVKRLHSLAIMLGELCTMTGNSYPYPLEESIQIARTVVSSTPENDSDAADRKVHLADRLDAMFQQTGVSKYLEEAIHLATAAIELSLKESLRQHLYYHGLATKIFERFDLFGSFDDLMNAVKHATEALKLLPDTDVNTAKYICLLADTKFALDVTHKSREPHRLFESALNHGYSALQSRLHAGQKLFEAHVRVWDWNGAYKAARMTIDCLTYLPFEDLAHTDKEIILQTTEWISSEGVAAALNAARPPFEVLSLLEASRCLEANSGVWCREDFERLRQEYPSKLDEFLAIRENLKRPITVSTSRSIDSSPRNAQAKRRYQATLDCDKLLTEIRSQPGFSNCLSHDDETRMLQAGSKGPVVVLIASRLRSDAIIIHRNIMEVVRLPNVNYDQLVDISDSRSRLLTVETSLWIWRTIAKPVLAHLGLSPAPSGNYPRLWLIPSGYMTSLPIHTAGDYRDSTSIWMSMLDYAVCSYIPSIKALILARERPASVLDNAGALLLSIQETPGCERLGFAAQEISSLHDICRIHGLDVSQPSSKEGVLQALGSCELFHFAASFNSNEEDPLKNQILLENGSITIKDILDAISRLPPPFLAYLSGGGTAKTVQRDYANESLHAVGALHMGGFRHTGGMLGPVNDETCYELSSFFYKAWSSRGFSDETVALCLHDATRTGRDRWKAEEVRIDLHSVIDEYDADGPIGMQWSLLVHLGP